MREIFEDKFKTLDLDTRQKIYSIIRDTPGIHFRELQRRSNQAVGALQYHVDVLLKKNLIRAERLGKFVRFFPVEQEPPAEEKITLSLLRQENVRKIILLLLSKKNVSIQKISAFLDLNPSTVFFHLQKLENANLLVRKRKGKKVYFSLINPEKAKELIIDYRHSFLDELVDSFVELWTQI